MQLITRPCTGSILHSSTQLSPLLKRLLSARGVNSEEELDFALKQLLPVSQLSSVQQAATLLADAIEQQRQILIIGDYDADGATATAVTIKGLNMMGHSAVDFLVPDRFIYGYGLTAEIVTLAKKFNPWLLMTVDNGVSSIEGVVAAKEEGYKVLITDHHLPGKVLPDADVMVNPNLKGDAFPSKFLAGVGVAFYILLALKRELIARDYFNRRNIKAPALTRLLDLVALGTVADLVPLDANNRILVEQGLRIIRSGYACAGIKALFHVAGRMESEACSNDFGFACGPRLNAAGRLADMSIGIRCLLSEDSEEASLLAKQLDELNQDRKQIEGGMKQQAERIVDHLTSQESSKETPPIICLYQADWHEGVVGIVASRLKECYYRPAIVFAQGENGLLKGSGRSIDGLHMRDMIDEVASLNPGLIQRFGGHAMAAGLTLKEQDYALFQKEIMQVVLRHAEPSTFKELIYTDGVLEAEEFTLQNAQHIRQIVPWGQRFPEPLFEGEFIIEYKRLLKDTHLKLKLSLIDSAIEVDAIAFFIDPELWPDKGSRVHLLFRLDVNRFRGNEQLQLIVLHCLV